MGRLIAASGVKVFQIETTLNNDTFPDSFAFLQKREWEWSLRDRATYAATLGGPRRARRRRWPAGSSTRSARPTP